MSPKLIFCTYKINDRTLAALSVLAKLDKVIYLGMLESALAYRFQDKILASALDLVEGG
ncbi:MAG: hypothetical protein U9N83_13990 [Thermodesulfobacteriota bacterium]|nr:hypothetical protein [Thermodesulfobacteriota bacterium]